MTFSGSFPHEGGYIAGDDLRDEAIAIGMPAVDALLDVLAHGSTQMRRGALEALFAIVPSAGEMHAMRILARADANLELREAAARLLGRCWSVASGKALIAALRLPPGYLELAASRALVERFDAYCTEYLEEKARAGKLRPMLVEALVHAERLPILRILVDHGHHDDAWALAVRGLLTSEDGYDPEQVLAEPDIDLEVVRTAAAAVLRERSPADAFRILAPWVTPGGARAEAILWEVDDRLSDYSTGDVPELIDPRWESRCERVGTDLANGIARGIAYYRLPLPGPRPFLPLSLPDDEEDPLPQPYPLLVVGFEPDGDWKPPEGDWMPTLYHVEHQSNGHACVQAHFIGFVLRPPAALANALEPLIRESPTGWASDLPADQLATFTDAIRASLPGAPAIAWGLEAVVASDPTFDLEMLFGLPVIHFEPRLRPWDGPQFYATPWPRLVEQARFSPAHVDELRAADALGPRSGIRLAVLWANSD